MAPAHRSAPLQAGPVGARLHAHQRADPQKGQKLQGMKPWVVAVAPARHGSSMPYHNPNP